MIIRINANGIKSNTDIFILYCWQLFYGNAVANGVKTSVIAGATHQEIEFLIKYKK